MSYRNMLIAVDSTDEADEVMTAATNLATEGCTLSSVTVVKPLARVYGGLDMTTMADTSVAFEREAMDQATKTLTALSERYGIGADNVHVRLGNPAQEVRELAEELGCDIIVLGTHGRHGLGLVLGSTANSVLHGVTCDVLAVRIHPTP